MHFEQKSKIHEEDSSQERSFRKIGDDQDGIMEEGFLANRPSISIESQPHHMNMKSLGQRLSTTASNNKMQKSMMVSNPQALEQSFHQQNL